MVIIEILLLFFQFIGYQAIFPNNGRQNSTKKSAFSVSYIKVSDEFGWICR